MAREDDFKKLIAHAKEYGFIFPSSDIYDGMGAVYDYGPMGVELKNNIKEYWWKAMVLLNDNIVGIDTAIFMHPKVWEASGHTSAFNDPLIDNKDSKKRYRADVLIEELIQKIETKINKEVQKAKKRFGENFRENEFLKTNQRVLANKEKIDKVKNRFVEALEKDDLKEIKQIIIDYEIACPESGTKNWTDVRQFNLMFETKVGSLSEDASSIYLRPETAQGIFVNFLNVQKTSRKRIPFGIAQIGKAFRNEIIARQFIFRMREFEQMEMQFFVRPGDEMKWYEYWKEKRMNWHQAMGFGENKYRFHIHDKLAHYANAASDIEYDFPIGFKEIEGIHSRTDFDLSQHQKYSGKKLQYFDPESNSSYIPYVVETSIGLDRTFLSVIANSFQEEKISHEDGKSDERIVMKIPPALAPVKLAVFPLVRKDNLPEIAGKIVANLKFSFYCQYDEKDSIGKRYRRHDAIGTPYCITIDHQSNSDNTVTIRDRDSMKQERVPIDSLKTIVNERINIKNLLNKI